MAKAFTVAMASLSSTTCMNNWSKSQVEIMAKPGAKNIHVVWEYFDLKKEGTDRQRTLGILLYLSQAVISQKQNYIEPVGPLESSPCENICRSYRSYERKAAKT